MQSSFGIIYSTSPVVRNRERRILRGRPNQALEDSGCKITRACAFRKPYPGHNGGANPDMINRATTAPVRWTARLRAASLPSAKCACSFHCNRQQKKKEFAAAALRLTSAPGPGIRDAPYQSDSVYGFCYGDPGDMPLQFLRACPETSLCAR